MAEAAAAPGGAAEGPSSRKRKAWDGPPPAAGDLGHAQFWWYRDPYGVDQGPHATTTMRSWFEAGYIPAVTPLAASYYGEVPSEMWLAAELWESPETEAFVLAEGAVRPAAATHPGGAVRGLQRSATAGGRVVSAATAEEDFRGF